MIYEELKENYTKVPYKKPVVLNVIELPNPISNDWRKMVIKLGITSTLLIFGVDTVAFASSGGIGGWAEGLYYGKFIEIAKWLIIGKCGWDCVSRLLKEDFQGAKKSVISCVIMFAVLFGLPHLLNEIENIFRGGL